MNKTKKYILINFITLFLGLIIIPGSVKELAFGAKTTKDGHSIEKTGLARSTKSTSEIASNDTADWIINYQNDTGSPVDIVLEDNIKTNQSYLGGSSKYDTNLFSATYQDESGSTITESSSARHLKLTSKNSIASPSSGYVVEMDSLGDQPIHTGGSTGGDGYEPVVYENGSEAKVFAVYHHHPYPSNSLGSSAFAKVTGINCFDIKNNFSQCAGYPKALSAKNNADLPGGVDYNSANYPQDEKIYTPNTNHAYVVNQKIYYAAQRVNDVGIGCWDIVNNTTCASAYTVLESNSPMRYPSVAPNITSTPATNLVYAAQIDSPVMLNNKIWVATAGTSQPKMLCFDPSNSSVCGTYPLIGQPAVNTASNVLHSSPTVVVGSKIFVHFQSGNTLTCFDTTTNAVCSGFNPAKDSVDTSYAIFASLDGNNVCLLPSLANNGTRCYDLSGNTSTPSFLSNLNNLLSSGVIRGVYTLGQKAYFANYSESKTHCYDFANNAICSGFGVNGIKTWTAPSGSDLGSGINETTEDYGYAKYQDCFLGLGNSGILWNFDPATGKSPCGNAVTITSDTPMLMNYCDQKTRSFLWDSIILYDNLSSQSDTVSVTLTNTANNASIFSGELTNQVKILNLKNQNIAHDGKVNFSFKLNSTSPLGSKSLRFGLIYSNSDGSKADPIQWCLSTTLQPSCSVDSIINTVGVSGTKNTIFQTISSDSNSLKVTKKQNCVDLKITKTVERSTSPVRFKLLVENKGQVAVSNSLLEDTLPNYLTAASPLNYTCQTIALASRCGDSTMLVKGQSLNKTIEYLPVGGSVAIYFDALIDPSIGDKSVLTNTARIIAPDDNPEDSTKLGDNVSSASVTVNKPSVTPTSTAQTTTPANTPTPTKIVTTGTESALVHWFGDGLKNLKIIILMFISTLSYWTYEKLKELVKLNKKYYG